MVPTFLDRDGGGGCGGGGGGFGGGGSGGGVLVVIMLMPMVMVAAAATSVSEHQRKIELRRKVVETCSKIGYKIWHAYIPGTYACEYVKVVCVYNTLDPRKHCAQISMLLATLHRLYSIRMAKTPSYND